MCKKWDSLRRFCIFVDIRYEFVCFMQSPAAVDFSEAERRLAGGVRLVKLIGDGYNISI